jgi:hypothetical protein
MLKDYHHPLKFASFDMGMISHLCSGQSSNATSKQYVVEVDGKTQIVPMSQLSRACYQLTKASVKAWLNSVSRQQSLGIKGMTCVWLVRPELLTEMRIPDKLPKHIDQQLRKTAKRREQRQRAKQRAKEADTVMHIAKPETSNPAAATPAQLSSLPPARLQQQQASGLPHSGKALLSNPKRTLEVIESQTLISPIYCFILAHTDRGY